MEHVWGRGEGREDQHKELVFRPCGRLGRHHIPYSQLCVHCLFDDIISHPLQSIMHSLLV